MLRRILSALFILVTLSLTACAASSGKTDTDSTVIDVRTAAEYDAGHLEGAQHIDVTLADFTAQISQLDRNEQYIVYCRTGNRSRDAVNIMRDQGFTDVRDAGSLHQAARTTGRQIVTS